MNTPMSKPFINFGAVLAWFGVLGQLYLILLNSPDSVVTTLIRFISYFTILTNTLVAICFTCLWLNPNSSWGKFFSRPSVLTAITVYIVVVGITYNTVLRFIWAPTGLQRAVDETLHFIMPGWFLIFWVMCVPKGSLKWNDLPAWLIFPFVYCIYILIRGSISNEYPYPFMDVAKLGYGTVALNSFYICLAFLLISVIFIAIGRRSAAKA